MLIRRGTASVQFHMQAVLSICSNFGENSLVKCLSQPKSAKNSLKIHYFSASRTFKVIDVGTPGKLVSSACYDRPNQQIYLQLFSR